MLKSAAANAVMKRDKTEGGLAPTFLRSGLKLA